MRETIKIEMTPESVFKVIRANELALGESFIEYNDIFQDSQELMKFALDKNYISKEKYEFWQEGFEDQEMGATENCEILSGCEEDYCIVEEKEDDGLDDAYERGILIYAELICSKQEYYDSFVELLKEKIEHDEVFTLTY